MDLQLTKPEPIASCHAVEEPKEEPKSSVDATMVAQRHRMMTDLMVMAVLGVSGPAFVVSSACASTAKIGSAATRPCDGE